jgi:hypothetical protein
MHGTNFKIESELRKHGQVLDLPSAARTVSVEPAGAGYVRITYLKPVHEISVETPSDREDAVAYVD